MKRGMGMWISQKLQKSEDNEKLVTGKVISGGDNLMISGENPAVSPQVVLPYGLYSVIPQGKTAVLAGSRVIGITGGGPAVAEVGEVCLYSKGGYILIKNNGDVIINGKKLEF